MSDDRTAARLRARLDELAATEDDLSRVRRALFTVADVAAVLERLPVLESARPAARAETPVPGARHTAADTLRYATAADVADDIARCLAAGDTAAATRALLQLASALQHTPSSTVAALTADGPADTGDGWSWAVAGIVELYTARANVPTPAWAQQVVGDPSARWSPWGDLGVGMVDEAAVPEPLLRRGVAIEDAELTTV